MNVAMRPSRRIVPIIVQQHVDDAANLYCTRSALVSAPHVRLRQLQGFDERLAAHLEGLHVAGDAARPMCEAALEVASVGAIFVATMRALDSRDSFWLERVLAISECVPHYRSGVISAFGWTDRERLQGIVRNLLGSGRAFARLVGLAACAVHRVDPNFSSVHSFEDPEPVVRARAYRTAAELGKRERVSRVGAAINDADPECQSWAAWSAVLLGDRQGGLEVVKHIATIPGPCRSRAFQLAIQALSVPAAHALLQSLARQPGDLRFIIRGAGLGGDPGYAPWLIGLMSDDKLARLSGEAFSFMTGVNLDSPDFERKRPENFESGPNDDPNDRNVEIDEDDGLPWPDQERVQAWWNANSHRFQRGVRYFMGEPLNRENCLRVLKEGYQRQRIAAAYYLSLLNPGTPLFEWRAPAWRQQRLLATMT